MQWSALTHPYFISGRALRRALEQQLARHAAALPRHACAADVGCGTQGYRFLLGRYAPRYVGMDVATAVACGYAPRGTRIIGLDGRLPAADASVDLVLSTQVLEHVEEPSEHLAELGRILKPGGLLLLSTHGNFIKHADGDYWRWTDRGLTLLLQRSGFSVASIAPVVTGYANLALHAIQPLHAAAARRRPLRWLSAPATAVLNTVGVILDRTRSSPADWWPCMYLCAARRTPGGRAGGDPREVPHQ